jgi:N-acetylglucosaminyldiphosphoundecaprenol N-acetyl-beta-D-mannosaminyltransferase
VPVDCADRAAVEGFIAEANDRCRHIVTLNPETVMMARRDPSLRAAIERADLITIDGIGILLALQLLQGRTRPIERVTGVDLVQYLAKQQQPLFLLGGQAGNGARAAERLGSAASWDLGDPAETNDRESLVRIRDAAARSLAVAYGVPAQTLWIERNRDALTEIGVRIAVGVGGAVDFLSGNVPRAPRWVQRIGLEWLYRLIREPWRWRRQLVLPVFAALVIGERMRSFRRSA